MEKMNKKTIAINVMPATKEKLDYIRIETGLPIGVIIDMLVAEYEVKAEVNGAN
jgi:hypothetical protein